MLHKVLCYIAPDWHLGVLDVKGVGVMNFHVARGGGAPLTLASQQGDIFKLFQ